MERVIGAFEGHGIDKVGCLFEEKVIDNRTPTYHSNSFLSQQRPYSAALPESQVILHDTCFNLEN